MKLYHVYLSSVDYYNKRNTFRVRPAGCDWQRTEMFDPISGRTVCISKRSGRKRCFPILKPVWAPRSCIWGGAYHMGCELSK